jgi:hypothetical protein
MLLKKSLSLLTLLLTLAACGGGGGGGGGGDSKSGGSENSQPVASTNSFGFQSAWQKFLSSPYSKKLVVSGSCTGTLDYTHSAVSESFSFYNSDLGFPHPTININPGFYVYNRIDTTSTLPGCVTSSSITRTTAYYDATTFSPYGYTGSTAFNGATSSTLTFREFNASVILPATVKVGDAGVVGTVNFHQIRSFKKAEILPEKTEVTYVIEPDTTKTAIVNIISKNYGDGNNLTMIDQTRYLIDLDGNLYLSSISQQYFGNLNLNLIAR